MEFEFEDKEFKSLMFDVYNLHPKASVLNKFPKLRAFPEFRKKINKLDNNKIIKYIILMYDENTPLKKVEDVNKRKLIAGKMALFPETDEGMFTEPYVSAIEGKNNIFNLKMMRYLRFHKNHKYSFLVTLENSYYNNLSQAMGGNNKAYDAAKKQKDDLKEAVDDLFNNDESEDIRNTLYDHIQMDELNLSPEEVSDYLEKNNRTYDELDPYKIKGWNFKLTSEIG